MLLDVNGQEAVRQELAEFTADDARTIRRYKALLQKYGLGASHWCRDCQRNERDFWEIQIKVSDQAIRFECPHRVLKFDGTTA